MRRAILHIGAEKTGTSSIQEFLYINRNILRDQGIFFPSSLGKKNHTRLAIYSANDDRARKMVKNPTFYNDLTSYRTEIYNSFNDEIVREESNQALQTIILSSEHMHSHLQEREDLLRLRALLPAVDDFKVIFYIRRQDRAAISLYSTALKSGKTEKTFLFPKAFQQGLPYRYDYLRAYKLWSSVFGKNAVVIRVFDKQEFLNGDLIDDFCFASEISLNVIYEKPSVINSSLDVNGVFLIRRLNKLKNSLEEEYSNSELRALRKILTASFSSSEKIYPDRAQAIKFLNQFKWSNTELRQLALPERSAELFDNNFSEYSDITSSEVGVRPINIEVICDTLIRAYLDLAKTKLKNAKLR